MTERRVIRLEMDYEGTDFHGFAPQPGLRTVARELGAGLERVLGEGVALQAGGRTDAGVHALGQVVSFSTSSRIQVSDLGRALNALTGGDVVVHSTSEAPPGFNARRDARSRRYAYRIWNAPEPSVWERRRSLHVAHTLDVEAMDLAVRSLVGCHDFRAFYTHQAQDDSPKETVRRVLRACWRRDEEEPRLVRLEIEANAFLRHMVRCIVGSSLLVGRGALPVDGLGRMLDSGERADAGPTAPPHGLTLLEVRYPEKL